MTRVLVVVWLTVLWIVLWRDLSLANAASGVVLSIAVTTLFPVSDRIAEPHRLRPVAIVVFVAWFAWKLVEANLVLAREVLTRRDTTRTGIIAVELRPTTDVVTTVIANAISLTPGTLTLETGSGPTTVYVHVLHLHDPDQVRSDIHRLEHLVRRAFGLPDRFDPPEAP